MSSELSYLDHSSSTRILQNLECHKSSSTESTNEHGGGEADVGAVAWAMGLERSAHVLLKLAQYLMVGSLRM